MTWFKKLSFLFVRNAYNFIIREKSALLQCFSSFHKFKQIDDHHIRLYIYVVRSFNISHTDQDKRKELKEKVDYFVSRMYMDMDNKTKR